MASFEWPPGGGSGSSGVLSLNGLTGNLTLAAGAGITITPSGGNTLTIAATGAGSWLLAGNAGTGGTGKLGTTDAQNFDIIAGNGTILTMINTYKGFSGSPTIIPADATAVNQFDLRTYASPTVTTIGATNTNFYSQLVYDNPNAGFDNSSGGMIASSSNFTNNGSGTINYASTNTNSASFNSNGVTQQFKGVTSENAISSGAEVSDYYGIVSGLSTTGGIINTSQSISSYANFNDATMGQANGVNQSFTIDGTTTNTQGVTGINSFISFSDTASTTNAAYGISSGIDLNDTVIVNGVNGYNLQLNLRDGSDPGGINLFSAGMNQEGSVVSNGTNGLNLNMQFSNTSDGGGVNAVNVYARTTDTAHLDSFTGLSSNPEFEGTSTVDNINLIAASMQLRGSAVAQNITGINVNPQISQTAAATNFTGIQVSPAIADTATVTNGISGIQVAPSSVPLLSSATGINIDMNSVDLSALALAGGAQKIGLSINDGSFSSNYAYTIPGAATFFQTNYLGGTAIVANGDPTSSFGFGNNLAHTVELHDDWSIDASGLGFVDVGFVGALNFDGGTTMARWTGALGGAGNPGGAGTLTDAIMFRAAGILPQGGTLTVTNAYGFQVDENLFGLTGTNSWGFYENTAVAENHLSKLAIATSTKKVANSDTALEIGTNKAFLNGRGTTVQKNALTPLAGMQFYDTTLNDLEWYNGTSWVSAAGGGSGTVTSVGFSVPASSIFGATGSPVTTSGTLGLTVTGTSGGVPYFDTASTLSSSAALAANQIVLGGGAGAAPVTLGSLGTTTTVLHGNAGGAPTFGAVSLTADVSGILPVANGGTGQSSYVDGELLIGNSVGNTLTKSTLTAGSNITITNGNGSITIAAAGGGSGSVTSVALSVPASSIFGVTGSPVTTSGTLGLTTSGNSGGIPYFDTASTLSSSAALTQNALLLGGGAGAAPTALGSLGTTTTVLHGNAAGAPTFGAVSLTADVSGTLPVANGGTGQSSYTDGQLLIGNSTGNTLTKTTLTAGANITITNGSGSITIASTGGGGGWTPTDSTSITTTGAGTYTVDSAAIGGKIGVLVVAAGGGGGVGQPSGAGSGGGGGTWYYQELAATPGMQFKYFVGAKGTGALSSTPGSAGLPGQNSYFGPILALGGSGGNGYGFPGTVRGNGSGQTLDQAASGFSYTNAITTNFTIPSGNGFFVGGSRSGATGSAGGAAGSGSDGGAGATDGGVGGDGAEFTDPITSTETAYGGGGGGGSYTGNGGAGGAGGGGAGTNAAGGAGGNATANTGGGGGGGVDDNGGDGADGIIIVFWQE